jgi:hypothetical protein
MRWCPLCPGVGVELGTRHVFSDCQSVAGVRKEKGIADFIAEGKNKGFGTEYIMTLYLYGLDFSNKMVDFMQCSKRGANLLALQDAWLANLAI